MKNIKYICIALVALLSKVSFADGLSTMYSTNPQLTNINESSNNLANSGFQLGWYGHLPDETYIKLIGVGQDLGLSILFNTRGLDCPINNYLLFKKSPKKANTYKYTVGNGCVATITTNVSKQSFTMSVNSLSKCFAEYTYQHFCDGNMDMTYINENTAMNFIGPQFIYQKDQNDNDYDYNDD